MSSKSDGAYKIWLRAVDSKGNKASWISINDEVKLDRTDPNQTGFEMNTPSSGWYNGSIAPKLTYTGNFSDTNGISRYIITLSGVQGSFLKVLLRHLGPSIPRHRINSALLVELRI